MGIWKALMPSIGSRPEGPKYWKKNLLWLLRAASSSYELTPLLPPYSHVAVPAMVSTAVTAKIFVICNFCLCSLLFVAKINAVY